MEKQVQSIIFSLNDLEQVAIRLFEIADKRKKWIFRGDLGTGKTTLIQALCRHLGVRETISSPTYSIINEYCYLPEGTSSPASIYHMDLYRLKNEEEALQIGIEEYLYGPDYCFIEWPDIINGLLPENLLEIRLLIIGDSKRKIIFV